MYAVIIGEFNIKRTQQQTFGNIYIGHIQTKFIELVNKYFVRNILNVYNLLPYFTTNTGIHCMDKCFLLMEFFVFPCKT